MEGIHDRNPSRLASSIQYFDPPSISALMGGDIGWAPLEC
jgi:hypothetical protein